MKLKAVTQIAKWAALTVVCTLMLSACGSKPPANQATPPAASSAQPPANSSPAAPAKKSWTTPPAMAIDTAKNYQATVTTNKGAIKIDLYAKDAPKTVNNFVFLAKEGFYNDIIFHRIIDTFMVQTGDPLGTGAGGPGYMFEDELKSPYKYEPGTVAMANAGPNTNGSQFFICSGADCANLDQKPDYSIFGKVVEGMDVVKKIAATPVKGSTPTEKVFIQTVTIAEK
ncbi:peptidylprolyl isomerase [Paenibacillus agricola]|uniref:Peptidyl-prolyl cis-trans isomerase n=1 Tax=Paenibacillus agricola TaxID=2716264 RepID=A0ABX0J398_9BACL|nr:peptidylprolyl isomerase [Paenibacillus agricola]NHN30764.1 peptidylprolyl isomerase [Paenibacillus agricola]